MRKIQTIFILFVSFAFFMFGVRDVLADCQEINPFVSSCGNGGLGVFQCSNQNVTYCCTQGPAECQIGTVTITPTFGANPTNFCTNGALNGTITCLPDRPNETFVCHSNEIPEYQGGQNCVSGARCVEGVGCQLIAPTNTPASVSTPPPTPPSRQISSTPTPNPRGSGNLTTDSFLILVNPLNVGYKFGGALGIFNVLRFDKPSDILNALLPFLFVFAGMILFVMLLWGGFEMLSSAATPDSKNAGQQRITAAIIGFVLLFVSYWIAQIVQFITGVNVLG